MNLFLSILAWALLAFACLRLWGIAQGCKENSRLIALAEMCGDNPVGRALFLPVVTIIISAAWLISRLFS